jgi:GntP family permease.
MTQASGCSVNLPGATEAQTLKTWTLMETILGTTGAIVGMIAFTLLS